MEVVDNGFVDVGIIAVSEASVVEEVVQAAVVRVELQRRHFLDELAGKIVFST